MDDTPRMLKALADPARLRIVEFLRRPDAACCTFGDRVCACDMEGVLGLSQPAVSHHLKLLIQAGLVIAEKDGRWTTYRLDHQAFAGLAGFLAEFSRPVSPANEGDLECACS